MNDFTTVFLFNDNTELLRQAIAFKWYGAFVIIIGIVFLLWTLSTIAKIQSPDRIVRFLIVACLMGMGIFFLTYKAEEPLCGQNCPCEEQCQHLLDIYNNHQYKIAEGTVHVLYKSVGGRDGGDIIEVGGTRININIYRVCGYRRLIISSDGVLQEGMYARIYYFEYKGLNDPYTPIDYIILQIDQKNK